MAPRAEEKGLRLTLDYSGDLPRTMIGDSGRIRQIVLNYVSNAIKFTNHGGVAIQVQRVGEPGEPMRVRISVVDSGIGIMEASQRRLFEKFTQLDSSTTRRYSGTGLGLAISKELAHLMNGSVGIRSKPGEGSTFWVELPLQPANTLPASAQSARPRKGGAVNCRVMLVEDNAVSRKLAAAMLERIGCEVTCADDGRQALALLESDRWDLILMDCQMPGLDGYSAAREIRGRTDHPRIPIVAITANAGPADREQCLNAGMDDYITKPLRSEVLHAVVERWTRGPRAMFRAAP